MNGGKLMPGLDRAPVALRDSRLFVDEVVTVATSSPRESCGRVECTTFALPPPTHTPIPKITIADICRPYRKKVKVARTRLPSGACGGFLSRSRFLAVSLQVT